MGKVPLFADLLLTLTLCGPYADPDLMPTLCGPYAYLNLIIKQKNSFTRQLIVIFSF